MLGLYCRDDDDDDDDDNDDDDDDDDAEITRTRMGTYDLLARVSKSSLAARQLQAVQAQNGAGCAG